MVYLIFGPQGSGKTTQAKKLAERAGLLLLDAGEVLRQLAREDTDEGRLVKELVERGELAPDEIVFRKIRQVLDSPEASSGVVSDGYPRNADQVEPFELLISEKGWQVDGVVVIDLSEKESIKRLRERALKEGRADDTPEAIRRRLAIYYEETQPVLDYYKQQGKVITVDGGGSIEEVDEKIWAELDGKKR